MQFKTWIEQNQNEIIKRFDEMYPKAKPIVDGRIVLPNVDNLSSIKASLTDYYILKDIREFPIHGFAGKNSYYSPQEQKRVELLMQQIQSSNSISPVIIVEEKNGPYVLEGGHRIAALVELKAISIPALIVLDLESLISYV